MSDCERFAQMAQDKWATVSESLRSLRGNERPWANRSGRSRQMSDHEQFTQVAQVKWAIRSKNVWLKKSIILFFSMFYIHFFKCANRSFPLFWWAMWVNRSDCSPKMGDVSDHKRFARIAQRKWQMSDREQIAQGVHQKWANEWIARFFERIGHSLIFGQKTSKSLGKPMSEFPALIKTQQVSYSMGLIFWWAKNLGPE